MKKILAVMTLAVLAFIGFAAMEVPASNGVGTINPSNVILTSNLGGAFYDSFYGTSVVEVEQGTTLNALISLQIRNQCPINGCNLSVGFAFDTITNFTTSTGTGYTNASNANPLNPLIALPNQDYAITITITAPANAPNLVLHRYEVNVVNLSNRSSNALQTLIGSWEGQVAIISPQQESYWSANQNYTNLNSGYSYVFESILSSQSNYQYSKSAAYFTNASTLYTKAGQAYNAANFAQASSYMIGALGQYNLAISSYQSSANSLASSNNNYTMLIPDGVILLGVGALIAGIGLVIGGIRRSS